METNKKSFLEGLFIGLILSMFLIGLLDNFIFGTANADEAPVPQIQATLPIDENMVWCVRQVNEFYDPAIDSTAIVDIDDDEAEWIWKARYGVLDEFADIWFQNSDVWADPYFARAQLYDAGFFLFNNEVYHNYWVHQNTWLRLSEEDREDIVRGYKPIEGFIYQYPSDVQPDLSQHQVDMEVQELIEKYTI